MTTLIVIGILYVVVAYLLGGPPSAGCAALGWGILLLCMREEDQ